MADAKTANPGATTTTTADPPGQGPAAAGLDERMTRVEQEQKEQRGLLDQILQAVTPGQAPAGPPAAPPGAAAPRDQTPGTILATIQTAVHDEIQAADRRRAAQQDETKWRDDVNTTLEQVRRERAPREPETGLRAGVQRLLLGRPS